MIIFSVTYVTLTLLRSPTDGYAEADVDLHWLEKNSVSGVEHVELPQFSIVDYSTVVWVERLLTGNYSRNHLQA